VPRLTAYGATDRGLQRDNNEDRFFCDAERGIFIVIDGVGGYEAGEVAAEIARDLVSMRLRYRSGTIEDRLRTAITTANKAIFFQSRPQPAQRGMACVLTAAVVLGGRVTVGHVGDTRLYEVRANGICKITRDHSLVGIREDRGELTEWEAMLHPRRNEILRDLGSEWHELEDEGFIDLYTFDFSPESALVLCSDGLTDLVPSEVIYQTIRDYAGRPEESVQALLELANHAGGQDNITAIVVEGDRFEGTVPKNGPSLYDTTAAHHRGGWHRALVSKSALVAYGVLLVTALVGLAFIIS
jgi:serine/threonine protein phosphatase PrpC